MKKWRECTTIPDYEFDPDGKYDGSLYKEDWDEIFNELYQRSETTEEWRYNDWQDPISTRNAYTEYFKKGGDDFIVLKYYDGMYALYEIKDESEIDEGASISAKVIEKIESGVSIRRAILESVPKKKVFEDVAGMDQENFEKLNSLFNKWFGNNSQWKFDSQETTNGIYVIRMQKNPVVDLNGSVTFDCDSNILNGEFYYQGLDEYFSASAPISLAGVKSILRDLQSQVEMADAETAEDEMGSSGNIYGY